MKKSLFIFGMAALALASCSNDDYLGDNIDKKSQNTDGAIIFSATKPSLTRGDLVGENAADKLSNAFVVYGTKHMTAAEDKTNANDAVVFDNYKVSYTANSAGNSVSNTNNWEYVGNAAYSSITGTQTVKYWDLSAAQGYTFYAFSSTNISYPANAADLVTVTKVTTKDGATDTKYDKGYNVTIKDGANVDNLFYADRVEVATADYKKPVTFTFRNLGSRVRVGFYETVPGYNVKIDNFFYDNDATAAVTTYAAMNIKSTTNFTASLQNIDATESNTYNVTYSDGGAGKPAVNTVMIQPTGAIETLWTLTLGDQITAATKLGESASAPTWDKTAGAYTTVLPNNATNPMLIRVDYTLTSTDGSNEVIKVKNARVIVPTQYVDWKSNFAYTYLFKISDNTNGRTGGDPTDPDNPDNEGLYPITFDAVVAATTDGTQETITSVATNSVATYAKASAVTTNNEYKQGEEIYFVNTNIAGAVIAPSAVKNSDVAVATEAGIYKLTGANTEADVLAKLYGINNGVTLGDNVGTLVADGLVPVSDDTELDFGTKGAVKFTPAAEGKYAYIYVTTKHVAPTYTAVGAAAYSAAATYYMKTTSNIYYTAAGINADNFDTYKAELYTKTAEGTQGVYDVKIVKVVAP